MSIYEQLEELYNNFQDASGYSMTKMAFLCRFRLNPAEAFKFPMMVQEVMATNDELRYMGVLLEFSDSVELNNPVIKEVK